MKGLWPLRYPQPKWMARVVIGSVLREGSGALRVVRNLSRKADGRLAYVTFTIRHCSWTGRCYTVCTASDLRMRGFRMVSVAPRPLRTRMDRKIYRAITGNECRRDGYSVTCCQVEGVA